MDYVLRGLWKRVPLDICSLRLTAVYGPGRQTEFYAKAGMVFGAGWHTDSAFLRCTFTNCNLFEAEFIGCKMVGSSFHATALRPLRVTGGDWSFAGLAGADLRGITVRDVRMREVDLTAAKCDNAVLAGVDLSGAQLHSASFMKSDLRGSDLTALDPTFVAVAGAIIEPAQAVVIAQVLGFEIR